MLLMTCNNVEPSFWETVINIIEPLCALGNIFLLIYFTAKEWKIAKNRDKQNQIEQIEIAKLDRQKLWYDKIVIERIINHLLDYFAETFNCIDEKSVREQTEKQELIKEITYIFKRYKRLIVPCLKIFSDTLARTINRQLQEYQDFLIREVDENRSLNFCRIENRSNEMKAKILKDIYEYDFQNNLKQDVENNE